MREVNKDEFYKIIENQDAVVSVEGDKYPYVAKYNLRHGKFLGEHRDGKYFLAN